LAEERSKVNSDRQKLWRSVSKQARRGWMGASHVVRLSKPGDMQLPVLWQTLAGLAWVPRLHLHFNQSDLN
jgi:hypothetical protein